MQWIRCLIPFHNESHLKEMAEHEVEAFLTLDTIVKVHRHPIFNA
ncbi:hypothetical protein [Acaryochloris marina]|nr:hypothetical protein I1H34_21885 [Acaryochloris marina S15]